MKLKHILTSIVAAAFVFAGCEDQVEISTLPGVEISSSVVGFVTNGGTQTITLSSDQAWSIDETKIPSWLTVSPLSGSAGETTISLTAVENKGSQKDVEIVINFANGKKQIIKLLQDGGEPSPSTCKDVIDGPDGASYKITGTVTSIANTHYGNFYMNDGTGEVYIYGTLDKKGNANSSSNSYDNLNDANNSSSWSLSVGDVITVQGPKKTYNETVELVDVTVINITKSLISVVGNSEYNVPKDESDLEVAVAYKGDDLKMKSDESWITISNFEVRNDTTFVNLHIAENLEDTRTGTVTFSSSIPGQASEATVTITQATGLSMYTLPFAEDFTAGLGAFEVLDVVAREDGKATWSTGSFSGKFYAKASAYGATNDSKSMLVSPKISLAGITSPVLTFEHAGKFATNQQEELTLWVSTDNCETWTQLLIPEHDNAYGWKDSGDISLASLAGKEYFNFAFQYSATVDNASTWEIANVKVEDRAASIKTIAELNNSAAVTEAVFEANLTDAIVTYVSGSNVFIQDATGGIQPYMRDSGLSAGTVINGKVTGNIKLYAGYAELTSINLGDATLTEGEVAATTITLAKLMKEYLRYQNCMVKLEGVTLDKTLNSSARDGVLSQGEATVAARLQDKNVTIEAGTGDLICFPTRYNATLQVGLWTPDHFEK